VQASGILAAHAADIKHLLDALEHTGSRTVTGAFLRVLFCLVSK
jgi:hypothetical protein